MNPVKPAGKGRGAVSNRTGRYEREQREAFDDGWGTLEQGEEDPPPLETVVTEERTRRIITTNDSPDIGFDRSINPYKGCEHGCVYCYARPTHAYIGLSPGLDFESRIVCKPDGPDLLRRELARPGYRCAVIALGANTDPYQPTERKLELTRRILEVLAAHDHPVAIVTKSALVARDLDILAPMAERRLVNVLVSITSLDRRLARRMEPRAAAPQRRLETVAVLRAAGVPTGVLTAPMIPGLNDHELEHILEAAAAAGALSAAYVLIRLPLEIKDLFAEWLDRHYPERAARVLNLIRETHAGQLYDPRFGARMRGTGTYADLLARRFEVAARRTGLAGPLPPLDCSRFHVAGANPPQLSLFRNA